MSSTQIEVAHNIYWMSRGSSIEIDGLKYGFFGGAESIDKHMRTPGIDWFHQESISQKELYDYFNNPFTNVDIMISHVPPSKFSIGVDWNSISRIALQEVYDQLEVKPKFWIFGHYHQNISGKYDQTRFIGLNATHYSQTSLLILKDGKLEHRGGDFSYSSYGNSIRDST